MRALVRAPPLARAIVLACTALSFTAAQADPSRSTSSAGIGEHSLVVPAAPPSEAVELAAIDPRWIDPAEPRFASAEPFGFRGVPIPEGELWRKWRSVQHAIQIEAALLAACRNDPADCPSEPARRFLDIIASGAAREGRARLGEINRAINLSVRPMSDLDQYGVVDWWASPLQTLAAGAGDCEDYAIAKYVALREAGLANGDLRLLVVRDTKLGEHHAVVAARLEGHWLVLDNRRFLLLEDMQLKQYVPIFAIDDDGVKRLVSSEMLERSSGNEPGAKRAASDPRPGAL